MSTGALWAAILLCSGLAFALKYGGQSLPVVMLENPRVSRLVALLPLALLAALTAVLTFGDGRSLTIDARAAGMAAAVIALLLRAPFLVVLVTAAVVAAITRALLG